MRISRVEKGGAGINKLSPISFAHPEQLKIVCSQYGNFSYICPVRVIAKRTLRTFWTKHKDCEEQLKAWYKEAQEADWKSAKDVKREYSSASILPGNRVVYNIKGNHYRLVVRINYDYRIVWIRFIGTHTEYNNIDATKI